MYMNVNTHFPERGPLHTVASLYSGVLRNSLPSAQLRLCCLASPSTELPFSIFFCFPGLFEQLIGTYTQAHTHMQASSTSQKPPSPQTPPSTPFSYKAGLVSTLVKRDPKQV